MEVHLRKFDIASIACHMVVITGRRATGKSFLVRDLLQRNRGAPIGAPVGTVVAGRDATLYSATSLRGQGGRLTLCADSHLAPSAVTALLLRGQGGREFTLC
jgi:hypothetical protein